MAEISRIRKKAAMRECPPSLELRPASWHLVEEKPESYAGPLIGCKTHWLRSFASLRIINT
jgi:hypothetical protein